MILVGTIRPSGALQLQQDRWVQLIESHPGLVSPPPREIVNPFTKQKATVRAPRTSARVVAAEAEVGSIAWSEDETPLLNVWSIAEPPPELRQMAEDVARDLGCIFVPEGSSEL